MTVLTRHSLPAAQRSSRVQRFARSASRSAPVLSSTTTANESSHGEGSPLSLPGCGLPSVRRREFPHKHEPSSRVSYIRT